MNCIPIAIIKRKKPPNIVCTGQVRALPALHMLVSRCLHVVSDPTEAEIRALSKAADPKDLPILAAAVREGCVYLTTYNVRLFQPGVESVTVLKPGGLVQRVRYLLAQMSSE